VYGRHGVFAYGFADAITWPGVVTMIVG
jgi:hypothetical protein